MAIGLVYLFGAPTHVYFALVNPAGYRGMSDWAPPVTELSRLFWEDWFLPNAHVLGLGIALIELTIAALILGRGMATRLGFLGALGFHGLLAALFGMWPYTVPMICILACMTTFHFDRGPSMAVLDRLSAPIKRRATPTSGIPADGVRALAASDRDN